MLTLSSVGKFSLFINPSISGFILVVAILKVASKSSFVRRFLLPDFYVFHPTEQMLTHACIPKY
jgi:hypothetical protein